jgi:hypothetical protein
MIIHLMKKTCTVPLIIFYVCFSPRDYKMAFPDPEDVNIHCDICQRVAHSSRQWQKKSWLPFPKVLDKLIKYCEELCPSPT